MAWELLPVDYTDAVWSGLKRYTQVDNPDGTVSFQDVTAYTGREKSFFGARDANRMNEALNTIMSMLENGTDLYEAFQNYFALQKQLFEAEANSEFEDFQSYAQQLKTQGDTIIANIQTATGVEFASFEDFLATLRARSTSAVQTTEVSTAADYQNWQNFLTQHMRDTDASLTVIETGYKTRMNTFESDQQAAFNAWFGSLQAQLSGDVAAKLTQETTELDERLSLLEHMVIQNDITAPVCNETGALLIDDLGFAIVADWKYKEE